MPDNQRDFIEFTGFQSPNYTIVPDELFDRLLSILSGAEIKVLLYVIRRTFGFKKEADSISFNQICSGIQTSDGRVVDQGTGLVKSTAQAAIKGLVGRKIILAIRNRSADRGNEPTTYKLNVVTQPPELKAPPYTDNRPRGLPKIDIALYRKSTTQETVIQETETSNTRRDEKSLDENGRTETDRIWHQEAGFRPVGQLLSKASPAAKSTLNPNEARQVIQAYVTDLAVQLGDEAKLSVSVTRMVNLYRRSGLSLATYTSVLMEARSRTKEATPGIKKRQWSDGQTVGRKNQFPYYVAIVEDILGLRKTRTGDSS